MCGFGTNLIHIHQVRTWTLQCYNPNNEAGYVRGKLGTRHERAPKHAYATFHKERPGGRGCGGGSDIDGPQEPTSMRPNGHLHAF